MSITDAARGTVDALVSNLDDLQRVHDGIVADAAANEAARLERIAELEASLASANALSLTELRNLSHGPRPRVGGKVDFDGTPFAAHDAVSRGKPRDWLYGATSNVGAGGFPVIRVVDGVTYLYGHMNTWWECFPIPGGMSAAARLARLSFTVATVLHWHPDGPFEWVDVTPQKEPKMNGDLWTGMADLYERAPDAALTFRRDSTDVFSLPLEGTTQTSGEPYDNRNPAHWYNPGHYTARLAIAPGAVVCVLGYMWLSHDDPKADLGSAKFVGCLSSDLFVSETSSGIPGETWKNYAMGHPRMPRIGVTPTLVGTLKGWPASRFAELPPVPRPLMPVLP